MICDFGFRLCLRLFFCAILLVFSLAGGTPPALAQLADQADLSAPSTLPISIGERYLPRPSPLTSSNSEIKASVAQATTNPIRRATNAALPATSQVPLEQMIGQMLMLGFWGDDAGDRWPRQLAGQIAQGQVGGVLFLAHNVKSASGVKGLTRLFRNAGGPMPPFISIDQEGGQVERLNRRIGFEEIPSAWTIAQTTNVNSASSVYSNLAGRLKEWGFNTNYGPVVDLNTNPGNPIIGQKNRAFSGRTEIATKFARSFIDGHRQQGLVTSVKHFPGHGSSRRDSHKGFTDISDTWSPEELGPFQQLINENRADMVMVGHLYLRDFGTAAEQAQGKPIPASLSPNVVTGLLRQRMGYNGIVITDDLDMGAIRKQFGQRETVIRAVQAGVDILILSNSADPRVNLPSEVISWLSDAAARDPQIRRNIEQSYWRIKRLKERL